MLCKCLFDEYGLILCHAAAPICVNLGVNKDQSPELGAFFLGLTILGQTKRVSAHVGSTFFHFLQLFWPKILQLKTSEGIEPIF